LADTESAARAEHRIQVGAADLFAHRAQGRLLQHLVGIAGAEQVQLRIGDAVLHVDLDADDVLVAGQHRQGVAEGLDLGRVDLEHALHRPRPLEVRAGLHHPRQLAEAQYHAALLLGDQHEAVERQPQHQGDGDPAPGAGTTASEQAAQGLEQAIEWIAAIAALARVAAVLAGPAGDVPGHACSVIDARDRASCPVRARGPSVGRDRIMCVVIADASRDDSRGGYRRPQAKAPAMAIRRHARRCAWRRNAPGPG
jgi:hypothetical protein